MILQLQLVAVFMLFSLPKVKCWLRHDVQMLHDQLLQGYNRDLSPNNNQSEPIDIYVSFRLYSITEFDDKAGKLSFIGDFNLTWTDDRMTWHPSQYGNITNVNMYAQKVWTPSLFVGKPYDGFKKISSDFVRVTYDNIGKASWIVSDLFHVSCIANIAYYPVDKQRCEIFLFPSSFRDNCKFHLPFKKVTTIGFIENGVWNFLSANITDVNDQHGNYITILVEFQRRPLFVLFNLLVPVGVVGFLNTFVFLLPPDPGERSAYGVTLMLAMAVFLTNISDKLPNVSEPHVARVSLYFLVDLLFSGMIMIFTILGLLLYNRQEDTLIPERIKRLVIACSKQQNAGTGIQQSLSERNVNQPKTQRWRQNKVQSIKEQIADDKDGLKDESMPGHLTFRDSLQLSEGNTEEAISKDRSKSCTWTEVGKLFDRFCLVLFFSLQTLRGLATVIDTVMYLNSDE